MMTEEHSRMVADAMVFAAEGAAYAWKVAATSQERPCVLWKPVLTRDGNMWCALYGANLQEGVSGFGKSPAEAMHAFDAAWNEPLKGTPS